MRAYRHSTIGIVLEVFCHYQYLCKVGSTTLDRISVQVYPADKWTGTLEVYTDRRTWLGAAKSCESMGLKFHHGHRTHYRHDYIIGQALKQNVSDFEGLWIGALRPEGSSRWHWLPSCNPYTSPPDVVVDSSDHILCEMLNATASYQRNVYGIPCNTTLPYVCRRTKGYYIDNPESFAIYNQSIVVDSELTLYKSLTEQSLEECIFLMFNYPSPLTQYWLNDGRCDVYTYPSHLLPVTVILEVGTENVTTIVAMDQGLTFNENYQPVPNIDYSYPCGMEYTSTTKNILSGHTDPFSEKANEREDSNRISSSNSGAADIHHPPSTSATSSGTTGVDAIGEMSSVSHPADILRTWSSTEEPPDANSPAMVSAFAAPDNTTKGYLCCPCTRSKNTTSKEIQVILTQIKKTLVLNKRSLTLYKRRNASATDNRRSSVTMGCLAVAILIIVIFFFVSVDLPRVIRWIKRGKTTTAILSRR